MFSTPISTNRVIPNGCFIFSLVFGGDEVEVQGNFNHEVGSILQYYIHTHALNIRQFVSEHRPSVSLFGWAKSHFI